MEKERSPYLLTGEDAGNNPSETKSRARNSSFTYDKIGGNGEVTNKSFLRFESVLSLHDRPGPSPTGRPGVVGSTL